MENRPGRRTRLYVLAELLCFLLIVGLLLLYVHHRSGSAGRNATNLSGRLEQAHRPGGRRRQADCPSGGSSPPGSG